VQLSDAWEPPRQEGGILELLRSRTRTRRRRRRRFWRASWVYLLPVFLNCGTFWIGPARFAVFLSLHDGDMSGLQKIFVSLHAAINAVNRLLLGHS
jgi:hypothetical protein